MKSKFEGTVKKKEKNDSVAAKAIAALAAARGFTNAKHQRRACRVLIDLAEQPEAVDAESRDADTTKRNRRDCQSTDGEESLSSPPKWNLVPTFSNLSSGDGNDYHYDEVLTCVSTEKSASTRMKVLEKSLDVPYFWH